MLQQRKYVQVRSTAQGPYLMGQQILECNAIVTSRGEMQLVSMVSRGCSLQLVHMLSSHDLAFQQKVLERMLQHKMVKPRLPTYLSNIGETNSNHLIVQSIKSGVSIHITNGCSSKHCATKKYQGLWQQQNMQMVGRLPKTLAWINDVFIKHYSNASSLMTVCQIFGLGQKGGKGYMNFPQK